MDNIIVTLLGAGLIASIYWFFFGKKDTIKYASEPIVITVNGGYSPSNIHIPPDRDVSLVFLRKDPQSCLEEIVFPDYKIKQYLPLNTPVTITLPSPHPHESEFHCSMNMYRGKIIST